MSRYYVEHDHYGIAFGWDRPLSTFFAQVADDNAKDPDELLLDLGDVFVRYTNITTFQQALAQHLRDIGISDFALSQQQLLQLLADQDNVALYG